MTCFPTYGGSGAIAAELGTQLALRGHEIHFISSAIPFRLTHFPDNLFFHEVEMTSYYPFPAPPYTLTLACSLANIARDHGLDLLHVHYAVPHATSAYLAREMLGEKAPRIITTLHGTDIMLVGEHPAYFAITKFSIEKTDGLTCVSSFLRNQTQKTFGIGDSLRVIHNFVDTERFKPAPSKAVRSRLAPKGEKIVAHVSNFRPVKRTADVIRVFSIIRREVPAILVLIGEGPDVASAKQLTAQLGMESDVLFLGLQVEVERLLPSADLLVLPSEMESFGLVALEAAACGVPVLATRQGGLPEVVEDGETGFLTPVGDIEAMARAGIASLSNEARHSAMGWKARLRARNSFDSRIIVPQYEEFYRTVLQGSCQRKA